MKALLVNPWVYDFKAFDFWNKPVGLLIVARILKRYGADITLLDCMDRQSPYYKTSTKTDAYGRGKYAYEIVDKPKVFAAVPRFYKRYGMPENQFINVLRNMTRPDIILVTSSMTYWYPGVFNAIRVLKDVFPKIPVILGGIYANLCPEHARAKSGADIVLEGKAETQLPKLLSRFGYSTQRPATFDEAIPDYSGYTNLSYGVVLTSCGCPFNCTYCATKILCPEFTAFSLSMVLEQISSISKHTNNIAFFDDALLLNKRLPQLLDSMAGRNPSLKMHASNGLHCRFLDKGIAHKMFHAGFETMYLSLESVDPHIQMQTGGKVNTDEFINAVNILKTTGFTSDALHAYILYGMPGQEHEEVIQSIQLCHDQSVNPHLCEFSPIPRTAEYDRTGFTENTDPLYHNNLFYTWYYPEPKYDVYRRIKRFLTRYQ